MRAAMIMAGVVVGFVAMAAAGSLARAQAGAMLNRHGSIPVGTLAVNVVGSVALGLLAAVGPPWSTLLAVAFLGSFTTFSSFAREVVVLLREGSLTLAASYVALTLVGGIVGAWFGLASSGA